VTPRLLDRVTIVPSVTNRLDPRVACCIVVARISQSIGNIECIILEKEDVVHFRKLMKNERGATAIEYVLIASLISVAAIAAMGAVGGKVSNVLSNVANAMT
jgi:pilus assembly protein Flp/PilA